MKNPNIVDMSKHRLVRRPAKTLKDFDTPAQYKAYTDAVLNVILEVGDTEAYKIYMSDISADSILNYLDLLVRNEISPDYARKMIEVHLSYV